MSQLLEDIAGSQTYLIYDNDLSRYLESKYFSRFTAGVASAVFKTIWKLVFRTETEECNANRAINWRALVLIAAKARALTTEWMANDPAYYSNISNNEEILRYLMRFLAFDTRVYEQLETHAKTSIQRYTTADSESVLFRVVSTRYKTRTRGRRREAVCQSEWSPN